MITDDRDVGDADHVSLRLVPRPATRNRAEVSDHVRPTLHETFAWPVSAGAVRPRSARRLRHAELLMAAQSQIAVLVSVN